MTDSPKDAPPCDTSKGSPRCGGEHMSHGEIYLRMVNKFGEIQEDLGALNNAARVVPTHDERIVRLLERMSRVEALLDATLPDLRATVARHTTAMNDMGQRLERRINEINQTVRTMRTLGVIFFSIASPVVAGVLIAVIIRLVEKFLGH